MTAVAYHVRPLVVILLLITTSCAQRAADVEISKGYPMNVIINAMPRHVFVFGKDYPDAFALTITNEGPGIVLVESDGADDETPQTLGLQGRAILRVMPGGTSSLTNISDEETRLDIDIFSFSPDAVPVDFSNPGK